jgi:UDP-N-acetylmuramyl-tripeptide synthetase
MKTIGEICEFFNLTIPPGVPEDRRVHQLSLDARELTAQDGFVAIQGHRHHGLNFLQQARDACLVFADRPLEGDEQAWLDAQGTSLQVIVVEGLGSRLGELANWFYDFPSRTLKVVGITGTNGKTSSAHYVAQLLLQLGQLPALIGTLGNGLYRRVGQSLPGALNTTPDAIKLQRLLAEYKQQGVNWVVMEVSSHALTLDRIAGMQFECVALTQLGRDHLDFHDTEQAYGEAKARLFSAYPSRHQVLNADDVLGRALAARLPGALSYTQRLEEDAGGVPPQLSCQEVCLTPEGMALNLKFVDSECPVHLPLMGRFNVENVLCALGVLTACGFDWAACCHALPKLKAVTGRMQKVAEHPTVIVDFAHTAGALEQVLDALHQHLPQANRSAALRSLPARLWVVFGCGGDRDAGKRPMMAKVAEQKADCVVLTNDNPRFEAPEKILADTLAGMEAPQRAQCILDRKEAIERVLQQAAPEDVVLIAGKGHEAYQDVQGEKRPFSDQQVVLDWLQAQTEKVRS